MTRLKYLMVFGVGILVLVGCKGSDIPVQPTYLQSYPNPWTLYTNGSLNTGWGFFFYPDGTTQSINLKDPTTSYTGQYCLSYVVTGFTPVDLDVTAGKYGVGFIFGASQGSSDFGQHYVDLSTGNFQTMSFWAKDAVGIFETNPPIPAVVAFGPGTYPLSNVAQATTLTSNWQQVNLSLPSPSNMTHVDSFFTSFMDNTTDAVVFPVTIYIDDLQYH